MHLPRVKLSKAILCPHIPVSDYNVSYLSVCDLGSVDYFSLVEFRKHWWCWVENLLPRGKTILTDPFILKVKFYYKTGTEIINILFMFLVLRWKLSWTSSDVGGIIGGQPKEVCGPPLLFCFLMLWWNTKQNQLEEKMVYSNLQVKIIKMLFLSWLSITCWACFLIYMYNIHLYVCMCVYVPYVCIFQERQENGIRSFGSVAA